MVVLGPGIPCIDSGGPPDARPSPLRGRRQHGAATGLGFQVMTSYGYVGVSENSVPLNPMVLLIIIPMKNGYFIGNIPYFQTNPCYDLLIFWSETHVKNK